MDRILPLLAPHACLGGEKPRVAALCAPLCFGGQRMAGMDRRGDSWTILIVNVSRVFHLGMGKHADRLGCSLATHPLPGSCTKQDSPFCKGCTSPSHRSVAGVPWGLAWAQWLHTLLRNNFGFSWEKLSSCLTRTCAWERGTGLNWLSCL